MSNKGYAFENEVEQFFLNIANQPRNQLLFERTFRVPTSGAMRGMKGDILTNIPWLPKQFMIECKSRTQSTKKEGKIIYLETEWIDKLNEEAKEVNRVPLLIFSFKRERKKHRIWVAAFEDFILDTKQYILTDLVVREPKKNKGILVISLEGLEKTFTKDENLHLYSYPYIPSKNGNIVFFPLVGCFDEMLLKIKENKERI